MILLTALLARGADLHMSQLMPLPLIVSCCSKIQIGLLNVFVRVCARVLFSAVTVNTVGGNILDWFLMLWPVIWLV